MDKNSRHLCFCSQKDIILFFTIILKFCTVGLKSRIFLNSFKGFYCRIQQDFVTIIQLKHIRKKLNLRYNLIVYDWQIVMIKKS